MTSILKVNSIQPQSGTTITFGSSGDTITISAGVTWSGSGASLTSLNASQLTSGTIPDDRLPSPTLIVKGDGSSVDASIQLNCHVNTHGVKIKAPPHSAAQSYTLILPQSVGTNGQVLASNGSNTNQLSWVSATETKPTIGSISPTVIENTQTAVTITGTNFVNGAYVDAINSTGAITTADTVSFTNATTLATNFTLPVDGTYFIRVENPDGNAVRSGTAILTVSDAPAWQTAAGSLGSFAAGSNVGTITLTATNSTSMAITSGALPGGLSLNSGSGSSTITGTESGATSETTYNFTIRATDAQAQTADRAFSITISVGINNAMRLQ
tara:strand:+ start:551 stop:1531 length:981 start_codon:yes stop_codon:yes gene_type:complete